MARERERVREREEEPLEYYPRDSFVYHDRTEQRNHLFSLPRVIHTRENQFYRSPKGTAAGRAGEGAGVGLFIPWQIAKYQDMKYPIWTMSIHGTAGKPVKFTEGFSGCHRHWMEAIFYRLGGKYIEVQDGVKYECEGEGVVCIPSYCIHGHFFLEAPKRGKITILSRLYENLGIQDMELVDRSPEYDAQGSPLGKFNIVKPVEETMYSRFSHTQWTRGEPRTIYERYLKNLVDENQWRMKSVRWIPADSVPWELTPQGKMKYLVHPWGDSVIRTLDCYLQEIPPGGRSGKHRHIFEEVLFVASGKGYDLHDGQRHDWAEEDLVCIPIGVTHQHFNADPERPAKLFGVHPRVYMFLGHGGIEQLEEAPDYQAEPNLRG